MPKIPRQRLVITFDDLPLQEAVRKLFVFGVRAPLAVSGHTATSNGALKLKCAYSFWSPSLSTCARVFLSSA